MKPLAKTVNTIVVSSASMEHVTNSPKRRQTGRLGTARKGSAMNRDGNLLGKERRTLAAMQLQRTRSAVSLKQIRKKGGGGGRNEEKEISI